MECKAMASVPRCAGVSCLLITSVLVSRGSFQKTKYSPTSTYLRGNPGLTEGSYLAHSRQIIYYSYVTPGLLNAALRDCVDLVFVTRKKGSKPQKVWETLGTTKPTRFSFGCCKALDSGEEECGQYFCLFCVTRVALQRKAASCPCCILSLLPQVASRRQQRWRPDQKPS